MRPRPVRFSLVTAKNTGPRRVIAIAFFLLAFWRPCGAQKADPLRPLAALSPLSLDQVRDAAFLARPSSELNFDAQLLRVWHRPDLEELLSTITQSSGIHGLTLYQVSIPAQASFKGPWTWIVAVAPWRKEAYELYSFQSERNWADLTRAFNEFASRLSLSLSKYELASFAEFFLETAIPIRPGEIVLDEDSLQEAVGRHYFTTYDEVWRSIDAYSQWWEDFSNAENRRDLAPKAEIEANGSYRVTLNRVVTIEGEHPQLQEWQLDISPQGNVRVAAMRPVFPKAPRWLFYDSPARMTGAPLQP